MSVLVFYVSYNGKVPVICVMIDTGLMLVWYSRISLVGFFIFSQTGGGVRMSVLGFCVGCNGKVRIICVMIDTLSVHGADASVVLKDQTGRFMCFVQWAVGRGGEVCLEFVCW